MTPYLKLPKSSSMGAVAIEEMGQRKTRALTVAVGPGKHHLHAEPAKEEHAFLTHMVPGIIKEQHCVVFPVNQFRVKISAEAANEHHEDIRVGVCLGQCVEHPAISI